MPGSVLSIQASRFAVCGAFITAFHVVVAASLIRLLQAAPPLANAAAFVLATVLSYGLNTRWSFSRPLRGATLVRFAAVSLAGLALTLAISGLAEAQGLHYGLGIAGVVCSVPPLTFLLHKAWTYGAGPDGRTEEKADPGPWLAACNGIVMFFAITRGAILDPRNTAWLMPGDPGTSFLGWQFFRRAPVLQIPFGANPAYGMEIGSSVVFTDSIPLLAFLFKPLASVLPESFQYFGMWILLSFVLQSVLGYKLLRRFCEDRWLAWVGSAFFTVAPVCIARLEGHFALFGQWVVLAALCLYFARRFSLPAWIALLAAGALIHFYLLAMAGAVWAADLWQRRRRNEIGTSRAAACFLAGICAILAVMWLAGYFMVGRGIGEGGFGHYRMNLLSPVDPDELWSLFLPDQPSQAGEYEGFNYLGTGMLLLGLLAAYLQLRQAPQGRIERASVVPLLCLSLGCTLLALSNHVMLASTEVLFLPLPEDLRLLADAFRSSGRMFWPVYYLIYLVILSFLFRRLPARVALAACATALAIQLADSSAALRHFTDKLAYPRAWSSPLKSALWNELGTRYQRVVYVLPRNAPESFLPLSAFAARHGMAINFGYFARVDPGKVEAARNALVIALRDQPLRRDSLYVFDRDLLFWAASERTRPSDVAGVLDGLRIIAPGLKECSRCDLRGLADVRAPAQRH